MNDIEENREKLRDLALQHIEPSPKVEHDDDSDAPSLGSHNTPSQRKYQRGGRKHDTFGNGNKPSEEFEYIDPTPASKQPFEAANSVNNNEEMPKERKHQRGGRKNKRSTRQDLESQKPWSQRNGRLRSPYPEGEGEEESQIAQDAEEPKSDKPEKLPTPFETGIKAFNLRRAEQSGGRPVGVSIDRGDKTNGETTKKSKKKSKKKAKKGKKRKESSSDDDSSSSSESEEDEKEKRKPLAIRLDLNLELEIFLRAKIKGEITITFL